MAKLYLFEGVCGSGKTTNSRLFYEYLLSKEIKAKYFEEGDINPADLSWMAVIPLGDFEEINRSHPEVEQRIRNASNVLDKYAVVAYHSLGLDAESELFKTLSSYELSSTKNEIEDFKSKHLAKWTDFVNNADQELTYVFESALLQNHLTYLILDYDLSDDYILSYFDDFFEVVERVDGEIVYLLPEDIDYAVRKAAHIRRPEYQDRNNVWIDRVIDYVAGTAYGKRMKIDSIEGFIDFVIRRSDLEHQIINKSNLKKNIIKHDLESWEKVKSSLEALV